MAYPANPKCQVHSEKTSHLYDKSFFSKKAKFLMKNKEDGQPYDFFGVRGGNRTRTATENRGILVPSKHAYSTWKLLQYYFRYLFSFIGFPVPITVIHVVWEW
jgi:hypothetical protein